MAEKSGMSPFPRPAKGTTMHLRMILINARIGRYVRLHMQCGNRTADPTSRRGRRANRGRPQAGAQSRDALRCLRILCRRGPRRRTRRPGPSPADNQTNVVDDATKRMPVPGTWLSCERFSLARQFSVAHVELAFARSWLNIEFLLTKLQSGCTHERRHTSHRSPEHGAQE